MNEKKKTPADYPHFIVRMSAKDKEAVIKALDAALVRRNRKMSNDLKKIKSGELVAEVLLRGLKSVK